MIYKITVHYPLHAACVNHWTGNHSGNSPQGCIQLTYIKSIDMLNKNTPGPGVKKSEAKSESYSCKRL